MFRSTLITAETSTVLWRSIQTFNFSRVVVALGLLLLLSLRSKGQWVYLDWSQSNLVCWIYLFASVLLLIANQLVVSKLDSSRLVKLARLQLIVDICAISVLFVESGGIKSGLGILYLFPLTGAAILSPILGALFITSGVVLIMLAFSIFQWIEAKEGYQISQSGLFGAGYFAIVFVVNQLAQALMRQEMLAVQRGKQLSLQQEINRQVISDMSDGILVLDDQDRIFECNPAAQKMLGVQASTVLNGLCIHDLVALKPIGEALLNVKSARQQSDDGVVGESISFVSIRSMHRETNSRLGIATHSSTLVDEDDYQFVRHFKLRIVPVEDDKLRIADQGYSLIFLQDVSDMENQAQQLKLASMGRLTASIAHEVRNPLSSISYAASLLNEDISSGTASVDQSTRLLKIVDENVARLNRLIEDILKLSRKAQQDVQPYSIQGFLDDLIAEFVETRKLSPDLIWLDPTDDFSIRFDPAHLREVTLNILSNAIRYASGQTASVRLIPLQTNTNQFELHFRDDGPTIPYQVRAHLFEPFYTTSRMGTGLGLYMARELCLNNGCQLDYEYRNEERADGSVETSGRFVINFSKSL